MINIVNILRRKLMPKLASKDTCTGCMACKDVCPKKAIYKRRGNDGHQYISIDSSLCIECQLCEKTCPVVNGKEYAKNTFDSDFYAGWSDSMPLRQNGATSGIFGTIADYFLKQDGWVAAAVMNGLECKYIMTDSYSDLLRMQGSKYTTSDPTDIYKSVRDGLKEGKNILFCGLPCHVAALLSFVPQNLKTNLYTIDLICGGVSSPLLIEKFVKFESGIKSIISFRNKKCGWKPEGYRYSLKYEKEDGTIICDDSKKKNLITDGFACELTNRYSCYNCQFSGIHRKSDITIGDLWGDQFFKDQHFNGVSAIIVHSENGKKLLERSNIILHEVSPNRILNHNHRFYDGKSNKVYLPERRFMGLFFNLFSYKNLLRIYASDLRTKNIIWWPFALYHIISFRLIGMITKMRDRKLLKKIIK